MLFRANREDLCNREPIAFSVEFSRTRRIALLQVCNNYENSKVKVDTLGHFVLAITIGSDDLNRL